MPPSQRPTGETVHGREALIHTPTSTLAAVDELARFLDGPRARGAFLLRALLDPPWSLRVEDRAPLSLVALTSGRTLVREEDGTGHLLEAGDIGLFRGPDAYTLADPPGTPPQIVIHPGQRCTTPDGVSVTEALTLGARTWGTGGHSPDATALLVGTYEHADELSRRLVDGLPPVIVLRRGDWDTPLVAVLDEEIGRDGPGQTVLLDRLLDLLVIAALRAWFARSGAAAPAWYRAHGDPVVGTALRLLQGEPARPWTVASLAAETGVSRAALARRFTDLVGEPPMAFLTGWRLALAADRLADGASVGEAAREVGYGSAYALSAAFKRVRGVSPRDHRDAAGSTSRRPVPAR
jgi:AraC-like DNA-binding protein